MCGLPPLGQGSVSSSGFFLVIDDCFGGVGRAIESCQATVRVGGKAREFHALFKLNKAHCKGVTMGSSGNLQSSG